MSVDVEPQPVLGRPGNPGRPNRSARAASAIALLAGLLNLASAALPAERSRLALLDAMVPGTVSSGAAVWTAAAGVGLILLAGGLRRHRRTAWVATLGLLAGSAVSHLVKGLDVEEALVEAFLAGLLTAKGDRFTAHPGPGERAPVVRPAIAVAVTTLTFGVAGLLVNRGDVAEDLPLRVLVVQAARMAAGFGTSLTVTGRFWRAFPGSVAAVFYLGAALVLAQALAPARCRRRVEPCLPAFVAGSGDSLAYFALRDDRAVAGEGGALVSYRGVGTVALAAGDPLGPRDAWPRAVGAFLAEAAAQGRIAAVLGCTADGAAVYAAAGLRTLYLGDEAVLDLDAFTLEGRPLRIARQSWNRARRAGWTCELARAGDLDPAATAELQAVSRRWRGEAAERGFSMALGRLFDPRDADAVVVAGRDGEGRLRGFLHLVPWGRDGASLDAMRRDRNAPAILNDFLVAEAARRLPCLGVRRLSLNFSFLRGVLEAGADPAAGLRLRLQRRLLLRLSGLFQIETLYRFNRKFAPAWQARHLAVEAPEDLPRVVLAALRAEGLVPRPALLRLRAPVRPRQRPALPRPRRAG